MSTNKTWVLIADNNAGSAPTWGAMPLVFDVYEDALNVAYQFANNSVGVSNGVWVTVLNYARQCYRIDADGAGVQVNEIDWQLFP